MYFTAFRKIPYNGKLAVNITQSVILKFKTMFNTTLWQVHSIVDGESPETLADKYYGNTKDHWVILLVNNIIDPYFDWVLNHNALKAKVISVYGEDNEYNVHHLINITTKQIVDQATTRQYVDNTGSIIQQLPFNFSPISNFEYETSLNDEKREIKILAPKYLQNFKNQFDDAMRGL